MRYTPSALALPAPAIVYDATSMPEPLPCALPLPRDPATLQSVTATDTMQVRIFTRRQKGFLVEFYNRCTSRGFLWVEFVNFLLSGAHLKFYRYGLLSWITLVACSLQRMDVLNLAIGVRLNL